MESLSTHQFLHASPLRRLKLERFRLELGKPFKSPECTFLAFRYSEALRFASSAKRPSHDAKPMFHRLYGTSSKSRGVRALGGQGVPDYLPATWTQSREKKPLGPSSDSTAEEAILWQLDALMDNDAPYLDHGVEIMYRFAGFDPFKPSTYFGPKFDLGQFERFRRIFHHTTYRVLLNHKKREILSSFYTSEHSFKQRVWVSGVRPGEEGIFEFSVEQRVGGSWDGYWLTSSLHPDEDAFSGGIAY